MEQQLTRGNTFEKRPFDFSALSQAMSDVRKSFVDIEAT